MWQSIVKLKPAVNRDYNLIRPQTYLVASLLSETVCSEISITISAKRAGDLIRI